MKKERVGWLVICGVLLILAAYFNFTSTNMTPSYSCNCPEQKECPTIKCPEQKPIETLHGCMKLIDDYKKLEAKIK
jgi:hypothetical protein